jgi:hypothetical protein
MAMISLPLVSFMKKRNSRRMATKAAIMPLHANAGNSDPVSAR